MSAYLEVNFPEPIKKVLEKGNFAQAVLGFDGKRKVFDKYFTRKTFLFLPRCKMDLLKVFPSCNKLTVYLPSFQHNKHSPGGKEKFKCK